MSDYYDEDAVPEWTEDAEDTSFEWAGEAEPEVEQDPIEAAFYADPLGAISYVSQAAAAQAAAEVAATYGQQDEQLTEGLAAYLYGEAENAMVQKYGQQEWDRLRPQVAARVAQQPGRIGGGTSDPQALAEAMEEQYLIVRRYDEERQKAAAWERVKNVPGGYVDQSYRR